jgi:hypothetical protein
LKAPVGSTTQPPENAQELLAFEGEFLYIPWHCLRLQAGGGLSVLEMGLDCETAGRDVE